MKYSIFLTALVAFMLSSCEKENFAPAGPGVVLTPNYSNATEGVADVENLSEDQDPTISPSSGDNVDNDSNTAGNTGVEIMEDGNSEGNYNDPATEVEANTEGNDPEIIIGGDMDGGYPDDEQNPGTESGPIILIEEHAGGGR